MLFDTNVVEVGLIHQLISKYDFISQNLCFTLFFCVQIPLKEHFVLILAMLKLCVIFLSMAMTIQILLSLDRVDLARYERTHTTKNATDLFN